MIGEWKFKEDTLVRLFQFPGFKEALDFINKVGKLAEKQNHHPKIVNVFNEVTLSLSLMMLKA